MKIPILTNFINKQVTSKANAILEKALDSQFRTQSASNYLNEQVYSPETKIDYAMAFEKSVWLCACVRAIAENCSKVPLRLYRKGSDVEITSGSVWEMLNAPNEYMTYYDLMEAIISYLELTGDAFVEVSKEKNGFKVLRSYWMEVKYSKSDGKFFYIYKPNGIIESTFTYEEMVHFKYFHPNSDFYGFSAAQAITDSLIMDFNANRYTKEFFKKGGMINLYLKVKASLQDFEFKRLKQEAQTNFAGVSNAHTIPVLDNDASFESAGMDVDKILLKTVKDKARDEILTAMGVPPIMLSTLAGYETYNNSEIQKRVFWENTIQPKLLKIQNIWNNRIFWTMGYEVLFDFTGIDALKEDEVKKAQIAANLVRNQIMTPNEIRQTMYDLNPLPGGDTFITTQPQPVAMTWSTNSLEKHDVPKAMNVAILKAAIDDHTKGYDNNLERVETVMCSFFHDVANKVLSKIHKAEMFSVSEAINSLDATTQKQLQDLLKDENIKTADYFTRSNYARQTGRQPTTSIVDKIQKKNIAHIDKWAEESATSITDTMKDRLATTLKNAQDKDVGQLTKDIREVFEGTARESFPHARMIARTELNRIANSARYEVAKENNFTKKTWIATTDNRSRHWHNGVMDGVTVDIDKKFTVGGIEMDYPGDPAGGPENNCNCRCAWVES